MTRVVIIAVCLSVISGIFTGNPRHCPAHLGLKHSYAGLLVYRIINTIGVRFTERDMDRRAPQIQDKHQLLDAPPDKEPCTIHVMLIVFCMI